MKIYFLLLALTISAQFQCISGLKLINNGYEDLYVVIGETVPESDELLDRIKTIFTEASALLYTATHRRTYFKSLKVMIPRTWTKKDSYSTLSGLASSTSHIKVGNTNMLMPVTVGTVACGKEAMHTYLPYKEFVMEYGSTEWGKHNSVIVHEWGHLRWGLKDEYPTIAKDSNKGNGDIGISGAGELFVQTVGDTIAFYQEDGKWKNVGCVRDLKGYASASSCSTGKATENCDQENSSIMIDCKFCPDMDQSANASIMSYQYIPSVVEFCDKDDQSTPEYMRHNSEAINAQNNHCNGKSSWEIMREHPDFKDGNNPSLVPEQSPVPEFQIFQVVDKVRVFVLDTSGSMKVDKIDNLYETAKYIIENVLPLGSWLSIISFATNATIRSKLTQLESDETRRTFVSSLPSSADGSTCIPCGLDAALQVLNDFAVLNSVKGTELILISDGQNNQGDFESAMQKCVDAGVVVHSVAVTMEADVRLEKISKETEGRLFHYNGTGFSSLTTFFSEIISGGQNPDSKAPITLRNEQITTTQNAPTYISFSIDDGIGNDTTVSVISNDIANLTIILTDPINASISQTAFHSKTLSLIVPGISEQGQYRAEVTSSYKSTLTVIVTSKPASSNAKVIRPLVRLSTDTLNFTDTKSLPIMYVYLLKGELPVKKASAQAIVEGPLGTETCILKLLDNGVDPDIKPGDGIYSATLLRKCQDGNGRHSSKLVIQGSKETVVTHYTPSGAAFIDVDAYAAENTATGIFERVAVADAYTVSNYDADLVDIDQTPPGRITDVQVIDIQTGIPSVSLTRNYTITWTAPGDDFSEGQASAYDMRISDDSNSLRHGFMSAERLTVNGSDMAPNVSGKVERLQMVVSSNDEFTATTYFAIVAIDDAGNRGDVSNIVPITIGLTSQIEVIEEECTNDCYATVKDCGRSLTISNGQVNFTNVLTTAGSSVPFICDAGYIQNGGSSIECLENGTWSQDVTCKIVDCEEPQIDNGGLVNGSETVFNGSAAVECNVGYEGGGTATCLDTGSWDTLPTCSPVDCGTPNITNGNFSGDTFYTGSATVVCNTGFDGTGAAQCSTAADWDILPGCTPKNCGSFTVQHGVFSGDTVYAGNASVACNAGYDLSGVVECGPDGSWAKPSPSCSPKNCGDPRKGNPDLIHSDLIGTTLFDASAYFKCHIGYDGGGPATCLDTGNWGPLPTCRPKDCGTPTVPNGNLTAESTTVFNGTGFVECHEGYEGGGAATCLSNATWDTLPPCTPVDCGTPTVPNGNLTTESVTVFKGTAAVECHEGYEGGAAATCLSNATWDTLPPCTPVDCESPKIPNGNLALGSDIFYNGTATVDCETGYELAGSNVATCLSNGTWDTLPICNPKDCGPLTDPVHGSVSAPLTHYTSVATYTCQSLWQLNGSDTLVCGADGHWYPDPPSCDEIDCPALKQPSDGSLSTSAVYVGSSVIVSCDTGFTLFGDGLIQCETGGTWDTSVGTCRRDCPVLTPPTNGDLSTTDVAEGTIVDITCDTAYTLGGANQITCLPGGSWNDVLADCTEDCQPLIIPGHGSISTNRLSQGTVVSVECEAGYTLFGASTLQCRTDATWNNVEPTCKLDCPSLSPPHNGKIDTLILSQGTVVTFSCNAGYTLFGDHQLTCQVDSTWDLPDPLCKQDCPALTHPTNGFFDTLEHRQTTIATAFCNDGYSLLGATSLTCKSDSTWDLPMPECRENCPGLTPPRDGTINSTDVKQETKVGVDCDAGYTLFGASLLICQSNATWDNPVPECRQDNATKAKDQMRIKNVVAITGSCVGLVFLIIIGLLFLTAIRASQKRNLRKSHIREIPPDYTMDDSFEEGGNSANAFHGWYIYSKRGFEYLNPDWNLRDRPQQPDKHDIFHRYF